MHGRQFAKIRSVRFDATQTPAVQVASSTTLRVKVPAHSVGAVSLRIVTDAGASPVVSRARYQYLAPPWVSTIFPSPGAIGVVGRSPSPVTTHRHHWRGMRQDVGHRCDSALVGAARAQVPANVRGAVTVRVVGRYGPSSSGPTFRFIGPPFRAVERARRHCGRPGGTIIGIDRTGVLEVSVGDQGATGLTGLSVTSADCDSGACGRIRRRQHGLRIRHIGRPVQLRRAAARPLTCQRRVGPVGGITRNCSIAAKRASGSARSIPPTSASRRRR